jgi:methylglutaconyl-CoA hydratase
MSAFETVTLTVRNYIAELSLNRPEKHKALKAQMIREIRQAVSEISSRESVRVVVLAARGKTFCAGGDLKWMKQQAAKSREGKIAESTELALMLRDLDELAKPLIGKIQGAAYGGGLGMISVCDIAVAADNAKFALTETKLGLIPATIGPYVVRRLGETNARQVFMNAKRFGVADAFRYGLISSFVNVERLDEVVRTEADAFLQCAPGAVADAKSLCLNLARNPDKDHLQMTANRLADRWQSTEARQGIEAFFSGTKAPWTE